MSDRDLADSPRASASEFRRPGGLRSLSLGVVVGPVIALVNQSTIYAAGTWACGHNARASLHVIPALCLIVAAGAAVGAFLNWRAVGRGVEDEHGGVETRTRFLAIVGLVVSVFSMLVIIAQWAAIFAFAACQRA
ncbi:MAG TPA: hypothetical protein VHV78_18305 [Gemmatimonadaceae bacterium]|nr:hypothetical protein [Gemmatimonadaceae bacterium]